MELAAQLATQDVQNVVTQKYVLDVLPLIHSLTDTVVMLTVSHANSKNAGNAQLDIYLALTQLVELALLIVEDAQMDFVSEVVVQQVEVLQLHA